MKSNRQIDKEYANPKYFDKYRAGMCYVPPPVRQQRKFGVVLAAIVLWGFAIAVFFVTLFPVVRFWLS